MFGDFKIFPDGLDLSDPSTRLCVCHYDNPTATLAMAIESYVQFLLFL